MANRRADWKPGVVAPAEPESVEAGGWDWLTFDDIAMTSVNWLWYPYIPRGRLTSIEGDPGVGKSWLISAIAAAVSTGTPLPGARAEDQKGPGKVMMLSGEDGHSDTLKPRLHACGANMGNIHFPAKNGKPAKFTLDAKGAAWLNENMAKLSAAVVFIDPVQLFMGSKVDMNRANEVREFMDSLHQAAEKTDCAVILVRHFNKGGNSTKLYKGLGSIDFAASLRSILQVELGANGVRQAHHVKCNNAPEGDTVTYTVSPFAWGPLIPHHTPPSNAKISRTPRKSEEAQAFIIEYLANGPRPAVEILQAGEAAGFTAATLNFAKRSVAKSHKQGRGEWVWELVEEGSDNDPSMGRPAPGRPVGGHGAENNGPDSPDRRRVVSEARRALDLDSPREAALGVGDSGGNDTGIVGDIGRDLARLDRPTGLTPLPGGTDGVQPMAPWELELARIKGLTSGGQK